MSDGTLIAVESIDGAGGTTVAHHLADGLACVRTFEPWTSAAIQELGNHAYDMKPMEQVFTFLKDRMAHQSRLETWLEDNHVVCDRYLGSTLAYQAPKLHKKYGDSIAHYVEKLHKMHEPWCREPDITVWIDVRPTEVEHRRGGDAFEDRETQRDAYHTYKYLYEGEFPAYGDGSDVIVLDGQLSEIEMCEQAVTEVRERL